MLSSISGQGERLAQQASLQQPPVAQSGKDSALGFGTVGTVAAAAAIGPIAGGGGSPLSNDTHFMIMVAGGGVPGGGATPSTAQSFRLHDDETKTPQGNEIGSHLPMDLQSFVTALTGITAPAASATSTPVTATAGVGDSSLKDEEIAANLGTIAAASTGAASTRRPSEPSKPESASPDPSWRNGWDGTPDSGNGLRQFGLAAYNANMQSTQGTPPTSTQQSITT